jgi:hypothetical protein
MEVSRTSRTHAHGRSTGQLRLRPGREGRHLFVAHMDPAKFAVATDGVPDGIEAVADDAVDVLHSRENCGLYECVRYEYAQESPPRSVCQSTRRLSNARRKRLATGTLEGTTGDVKVLLGGVPYRDLCAA